MQAIFQLNTRVTRAAYILGSNQTTAMTIKEELDKIKSKIKFLQSTKTAIKWYAWFKNTK